MALIFTVGLGKFVFVLFCSKLYLAKVQKAYHHSPLVPTNARKVRNTIVALVCTSADGEVSHLTLQNLKPTRGAKTSAESKHSVTTGAGEMSNCGK